MNREDINCMAREAGAGEWGDSVIPAMMDIEKFAALVAAAERRKFCATLRQLHDVYSLQSDVSGLHARSNQ